MMRPSDTETTGSREAEEPVALEAILDDLRPTPSAYLSAARRIEAADLSGLRPANVSFLSSFTSEILQPLPEPGPTRNLYQGLTGPKYIWSETTYENS